MVKPRGGGRQARARARNPVYAAQQAAIKVEKRKSKKQARKTERALQTILVHLHTPDAGRRSRKEARRWVQGQLEAKLITGHIAMELFRFLKERETGRKTKGSLEEKDMSEQAAAVWAQYLRKVAGDEQAPAGNEAEAGAVVAEEGVAKEDSGVLEAREDDEEEDDDQIMLSPKPQNSEEEVGALDAMEEDNRVMLCFRTREIGEGDL